MDDQVIDQLLYNVSEISYDYIEQFSNYFQNTRSDLLILSLNVQCLKNKITDIEILIAELGNIDILILSESWLTTTDKRFYEITNFTSFHSTRPTKVGGGIVIYVHNRLNSKFISSVESDDYNLLTVAIRNNNLKFTIIGIYNSKTSTSQSFVSSLETIVDSYSQEALILAGDFNINIFDQTSLYTKCYTLFCASFGLHICNKKFPTRITTNSSTLIDHFLVNNPCYNYNVFNIKSSISDHNILILNVITHSMKEVEVRKDKKLEYNRQFVDYTKLNDYFTNFNFIPDGTIDECYDSLLKYIADGIKTSSKNITIRNLSHKYKFNFPWITAELLILIRRKNILHAHTKKYPLNEHIKYEFNRLRNLITSEKRKLKFQYYEKSLQSNCSNPKKFWNTVNEIMTNSMPSQLDTRILNLKLNNNFLSSSEIPRAFNNFFC